MEQKIQKLELTYTSLKPQISAKGKPYTSQSIKAKQYGEKYLSGFASKETENWKAGDVVEVEVTESDKLDKTGKPYLNWKLPNKEDAINTKISAIEFSITNIHRKIDEIVAEIKKLKDNGLTSAGTKVPDFTPNTPEQTKDFEEKMETYESELASLDALAEQHFNEL